MFTVLYFPFRFFFFSMLIWVNLGALYAGVPYLCNYKGRGRGGVIYLPLNNFNVNLSDHNKGKKHAIPIYSWIDYKFPISQTPRTLDSGSQTYHETLEYSLHLKQGSTVIPHPKKLN
jgi:hypothetical protein